jgi:GntR family transcriptional regulator/MocR family aminotransferase
LYVVLYRSIKDDILQGHLKANEKLPSKRKIAQHLMISVVTVENTYAQLVLEGYVYTKEKNGYFVCPMQEIVSNPLINIPRVARQRQTDRKYFVDFQTNTICPDKFPFSVWAKLMREVLSEEYQALLEATPFNGIEKLREGIAAYLYRFRGMWVSPEQIIIGAGTEYLYSMITKLLGRNSVYALENPGYKKIAQIYNSNGVACKYINMDDKGLLMAELIESGANVAHISPSHHFPTGLVMPIGRRQELLMWANENEERFIIEDDYDSEFRFSGKPIQTLQSIDANQKVIYINTFSKTLMPSIRISYMILPRQLMDRYQESLSFYACAVPSFEQYTLAKFIADGYFEQHISRMRTFYKKQRDSVIQAFKSSTIYHKVKILEEDAGLHFLMRIETTKSDASIVAAAADAGIRISCLSEYFYHADAKANSTVIINYSGIDNGRIEEAVARLARVFE